MDWKTLFLSAQGRMGQRDFWIGFIALFVANMIVGNLGPLSFLGLVLIYPAVCIYAKRLHDFGRSGWLMMIPFGASLAGVVIMFMAGGAALLGAASGSSTAAGAGALMGGGVILIVALAILVISIGFIIWVGTRPSDGGDNLYGPPPVRLVTAV